jgi:hypothetical protein
VLAGLSALVAVSFHDVFLGHTDQAGELLRTDSECPKEELAFHADNASSGIQDALDSANVAPGPVRTNVGTVCAIHGAVPHRERVDLGPQLLIEVLRTPYENCVRWAAEFGLTRLSNYVLFNASDTPEDFYTRLRISVDF